MNRENREKNYKEDLICLFLSIKNIFSMTSADNEREFNHRLHISIYERQSEPQSLYLQKAMKHNLEIGNKIAIKRRQIIFHYCGQNRYNSDLLKLQLYISVLKFI